jgi:hypothetical protein
MNTSCNIVIAMLLTFFGIISITESKIANKWAIEMTENYLVL